MQKIDEIQAESVNMLKSINSKNENVAIQQRNAIDDQIQNRIQQAILNFPIPNTKEDLVEFITLCQGNKQQYPWDLKLKQVISKAKVILPNDQEIQALVEQYEEEQRIEEESAKKFLKYLGLGFLIFFIIVAIGCTIEELLR